MSTTQFDHTEQCASNGYVCSDPHSVFLFFDPPADDWVDRARTEMGEEAPLCAVIDRAKQLAGSG